MRDEHLILFGELRVGLEHDPNGLIHCVNRDNTPLMLVQGVNELLEYAFSRFELQSKITLAHIGAYLNRVNELDSAVHVDSFLL